MERKVNIIIIILSTLLAISIVGLIITFVYHYVQNNPTSVEVPGNIITPEKDDSTSDDDKQTDNTNNPDTSNSYESNDKKTSINSVKAKAFSLYNRKPEDNTPFKVTNMFPGDRETLYYCIRVSHKGNIIVRYHANIHPEYEKLAEVLKIRINLPETNELLYDGLMKDMPESLNYPLYTDKSTQSEIYYEITTYLDTSVGNDYMDKELIADFKWWVEETSLLDSPNTGDTLNFKILFCIALCSLIIIILPFNKRRKETANEF